MRESLHREQLAISQVGRVEPAGAIVRTLVAETRIALDAAAEFQL